MPRVGQWLLLCLLADWLFCAYVFVDQFLDCAGNPFAAILLTAYVGIAMLFTPWALGVALVAGVLVAVAEPLKTPIRRRRAGLAAGILLAACALLGGYAAIHTGGTCGPTGIR